MCKSSFTAQNSGKHRLFFTGLKPNLFLFHCAVVWAWKTSHFLCSAAARAKKYPLSWLVADVDFHWFQQDFVQVEGSVWVDVPVGCVPWVRHTEMYSSPTLPFMLAFKNVTDTLGSAGEGAWFVTKLWLSVISYNLQMARLVEMLKTSRSHSVSCVKQMRQMAVAVFIFIHIHLHLQLMFQLPSRFPLDSI